MSDTPRTDAVVAAFPKTLPLGGTYSDMAEDARDWAIEHARTLERELAELRETLTDPVVVFANMLRGIIAPITMRQAAHVAGDAEVKRLNAMEEAVQYAVELQGVVKAAEVILGLWSETELDPEDEEYEVWMAAFNESVTAFLADARAARTKQQFE